MAAPPAELADPQLAGIDTIECGDVRDPAMLAAALIRQGIEPGSFAAVHTDKEAAIVAAAVIASHLGARGLPLETAIAMRDKHVQKQRVERAAVPVARHALIPVSADPADAVRSLEFPLVVKPVAASATDGVCVVADLPALAARVAELRGTAHGRAPLLAEQFVAGAELHADGVILDGALRFLSVSRYIVNCLDIRDGAVPGSVCLSQARHPELYRESARLVRASLAALGLDRGVFHLEFFHTGRGLVFSECAARPGGSMIVDAVAEQYGVDLGAAGYAIAGGREPDLETTMSDHIYGYCHLPAPPGRLLRAPRAEELRRLPGVSRVRMQRAIGAQMPDSTRSTADWLGLVLVRARDEAEIRRRFDAIVDHVRCAVEVGR